jgi:hypothetical protein
VITAKDAFLETSKILEERSSRNLKKEKIIFENFLDWLDVKIKERLDSGYSMSFYLREYLSYVNVEAIETCSFPSWMKVILEDMGYSINTSKYQCNDECISISWEKPYKIV